MNTDLDQALSNILKSAIGARAMPATLSDDTPLLGAIPELDSMALLAVLTRIEDDYECSIGDDDVSAADFATFGTLKAFVAGIVDPDAAPDGSANS